MQQSSLASSKNSVFNGFPLTISTRELEKNSTATSKKFMNKNKIEKVKSNTKLDHYFSNKNVQTKKLLRQKSPSIKFIQSRNAYYQPNKQKKSTKTRENINTILNPHQPSKLTKLTDPNILKWENHLKTQNPIRRENLLSDPKSHHKSKTSSLKRIKSIQRIGLIDSNGKIILPINNHKKIRSSINMNSLDLHHGFRSKIYHSRESNHVRNSKDKFNIGKPAPNHKKTKSQFKKKKSVSRKPQKLRPQKLKSINLISKIQQSITPSLIRLRSQQIIDIQDAKKDIKQQKQKVKEIPKFVISNPLHRLKAIKLIGELCQKLCLRRQTYCLAVNYLDRYLQIEYYCNNILLCGASTVLIAIKLDQPQRISKFAQVFVKMNILKSKRESFGKYERHKKSASNQQKIRKSSSKSHSKSKKKAVQDNKNYPILRNCQIKINQIYQKEIQILIKLNFSLYTRTISDWIDLLTLLWDQYLFTTSNNSHFLQNYTQIQNLYFRTNRNTTMISHLIQILDLAFLEISGYRYSKVVMTLSIMYLLIRISIQLGKRNNHYQGSYAYYKASLKKSSNLIFIQVKGSNQLFGDFLNTIDLSLGDLVNCCQYLSQFLLSETLITFNYENKVEQDSMEHCLSLYNYNPLLFQHLNKDIDKNI